MPKLLFFFSFIFILLSVCSAKSAFQEELEQFAAREVFKMTASQREDPTNRDHDTECATTEYYEVQKRLTEPVDDPRW